MFRLASAFALTAFVAAAPAMAEEGANADAPNAAEVAFFESKIRPVLVKHCYECHSAEAGVAEGGLRLDDRSAIRAGGTRGPAVIPGRPEAGLLLTAIAHADRDLAMPPDQPQLPKEVIADFRRWIERGAHDPRDGAATVASDRETLLAQAKNFWAYRRPVASPPPAVADETWPRDDVDRFVLARLTEQGLAPSPDASPETLVRRLHFDLIGLPPSPEAIDSFLAEASAKGIDAAIAAEADRLLASPAFGERWGRHWLDVARFGESSGKEANIPFPYAWRYRDYVIDSVADDVPYDRFLTEQIAGDLLPYESNRERARLLVATGFLAVGTKNLSESNETQFHADLVDEQIDSLSRALIGSSIACARCHDHKFDPFSMKDYYALAGVFESSKTYFGTFVSPASQQGGELIRLPRLDDEVALHPSVTAKRYAEMKEQLAALEAERAEMDEAQKEFLAGRKPKKEFTLTDALRNIWQTGPLVGKLQTIDEQGRAVPVAMGVLDDPAPTESPLFARGEIARPGDPVPRGYPEALRFDSAPPIPQDASGRLQLAQWLTHPEHPLTARVFVNRVWSHLFGEGLVRTVDDFGRTGEGPSHPELLDTLAVDFAKEGQSLKRLVRRLVLTRTYRQASIFDGNAFHADPDNRFLWRMPKRRLEAEAIRDAMLAVSGELDLDRPQGSLVAKKVLDKPISLIGLDKALPEDLDGSTTRSVYLPVIRDRLPDVLELFDFAEPALVTGKRDTTNVPVQALYLMNSPFVRQRAEAFARRLAKAANNREARIELAFRLSLGRLPEPHEIERASAYLASASDADAAESSTADSVAVDEEGWNRFCQALLSTAEFRQLD
ncbi:MAG TPA: PSD1 and planctomycete cytochrome C domain-containing protein [Pirellulaceae bacterium]|jgi:hypothetical protein|nr:PSD1 and planctomycete cytochrome C domain-containing protein [Pirellulaceae bacterium]